MKILFISDYSLEHTLGGAQRSNNIVIEEGIKRGHDIELLTFDKSLDRIRNHYDIVISSNLERFTSTTPEILDFLAEIPNHSRLEHDMCFYLSEEQRKTLYGNCNHSFFLTDYHYSKFRENYGDYFKNIRIVPDPISRDFTDFGNPREDVILYTGFFHPLKGTNEFCQFTVENPDKKFIVAGWGDNRYISFFSSAKNINFLGAIKHEEMPKVYNHCLSFYYTPIVDEPFCRSFGEALCCGIKNFTINEKIGSYHLYKKLGIDKFKEECYNAEQTFWEILE